VFLYYTVTGPFTTLEGADPQREGGFFGGTTIAISPKKIAEEDRRPRFDWGPIADLSIKYEMEHVSKFGMLPLLRLNWDLKAPFLDFASATTVIRERPIAHGVDLQLGAAWQKSFSLASQDSSSAGSSSWGVFRRGLLQAEHRHRATVAGRWHPGGPRPGQHVLPRQPQLLWDFGKVVQFTPAKVYLGFEYQIAFPPLPDREQVGERAAGAWVRWNI